ncbi:MAG: hypothetical protein PHN51_01540 [Candidatus Nanopelagicales bacterium]|nr:hypothetical protein [Candidatus Nanopelagicales bacterium]
MNTNRNQAQINRPTSTKQKVMSSVLAAGVFFGIGGLIATRTADSASTVAAGGGASASAGSVKAVTYTKKSNTSTAKKSAVVHATTKASKG